MKFICGACFREITHLELGRNHYGEILCKTCYTSTNNETLNEKKLRLIAERDELTLQIGQLTKQIESRVARYD